MKCKKQLIKILIHYYAVMIFKKIIIKQKIQKNLLNIFQIQIMKLKLKLKYKNYLKFNK